MLNRQMKKRILALVMLLVVSISAFAAEGTAAPSIDRTEQAALSIDRTEQAARAVTEVLDDGAVPPEAPKSEPDKYFRVEGAASLDGALLESYVMPYDDDTYYSYGYQSVLLYDSDVDMTAVKPTFWTAEHCVVYVGDALQISGESEQDFSQGPVLYRVEDETGTVLKSYEIRYVPSVETGASLYVNGPDERIVFLTNQNASHEIFFANVGPDNLDGAYLALRASNVRLATALELSDEKDEGLAPLLLTEAFAVAEEERFSVSEEDQFSVAVAEGDGFADAEAIVPVASDSLSTISTAKVLLVPSDPDDANYSSDGVIEGTLTIGSDNGGLRVITLRGKVGDPVITTDAIKDGIKFVPFSRRIDTDNQYYEGTDSFRITEGTLPKGLELFPDGEIYGVSLEEGTFQFTVEARFGYEQFDSAYADYTLVINGNSDDYVAGSSDSGYEFTLPLPDVMRTFAADTVVSEGPFNEFVRIYLDGRVLTPDQEYFVREGSTRITINGQVFEGAGNGSHTIAAEFRVDGDRSKDMKTAAQNFTIDVQPQQPGPTPTPSGGGGGGGSDNNNESAGGSIVVPITEKDEEAGQDGQKEQDDPAPLPNLRIEATVTDDKATAVLPAATLAAAAKTRQDIVVSSPLGDVLIDTLAVQTLGGTADILVTYTVAYASGGRMDASVMFTRGGAAISTYGKGLVTLSVPYTLPEGARWTQVVPYLNDGGVLLLTMGGYNNATKRAEIHMRRLTGSAIRIKESGYRETDQSEALDWALQRGLLDLFAVDGRIQKERMIDRADFVSALVRALAIEPPKPFTTAQFDDVSGVQAEYIRSARAHGIAGGIGVNLFDPDRPARRGEQYQILYNLIQKQFVQPAATLSNKTIADFKDSSAVPGWLVPALNELIRLGLISESTVLDLNASFTVDEACATLWDIATPKRATSVMNDTQIRLDEDLNADLKED